MSELATSFEVRSLFRQYRVSFGAAVGPSLLEEAGSVKYQKGLAAKIDELLSGNESGYNLSVMLYRKAGDKIKVGRLMEGTD